MAMKASKEKTRALVNTTVSVACHCKIYVDFQWIQSLVVQPSMFVLGMAEKPPKKPRVFAIFRQGAKSSSPVRDGLESRKLKPIMRCLCVAHISQSMNALGRTPELNAGEGTALKNSLTSLSFLKLPERKQRPRHRKPRPGSLRSFSRAFRGERKDVETLLSAAVGRL